jgi:hypothetical protein
MAYAAPGSILGSLLCATASCEEEIMPVGTGNGGRNAALYCGFGCSSVLGSVGGPS